MRFPLMIPARLWRLPSRAVTAGSAVVLLLLFLSAAWGHHAVQKKKEVLWDPEEIRLSLARGESSSLRVGVSVNHPIAPRPALTIPPPLDRSMSIERLGAVGRGNKISYFFRISVSVPPDTPKGEFSGMIRLSRVLPNDSPFPVPMNLEGLPVTLTVEGTRVSDPGGQYSLTIPEGWISSFGGEDHVLIVHSPGVNRDRGEAPRITAVVDGNPGLLSTQEYYDGDPGLDLFGESSTVSTTSVGGLPAYRFDLFMTLVGTIVYVVPDRDRFIMITDEGATFQGDESFQQLLDSLKVEGE